jgi:hypothetical protein
MFDEHGQIYLDHSGVPPQTIQPKIQRSIADFVSLHYIEGTTRLINIFSAIPDGL